MNGALSKDVSPRMASAKEHESVNVTILPNPMEVLSVSGEILSQNLALPTCVVTFCFSFYA